MFGSITLNPFRVDSTNNGKSYQLDPDNTQTYFTIQMNYARRWAWRPGSQTKNGEPETIANDFRTGWEEVFTRHLDFQARVGYTFGEDATNASTIIGSGNLDLELSVGKQLWRNVDPNTGFAHSLNLETSVSIVTDRQFSDAHSAWFLGPAYVVAFNKKSNGNLIALLFRGGLARYELPRLMDGGLNIQTDENGFPSYHSVWGAVFEGEAHYQLLDGFVTAGVRAYPSSRPAPWTFWIGYSVTTAQLSSFFHPKN